MKTTPIPGDPRVEPGDASSTSPVRKAVFPMASLGARLLPATKAFPKELLPVVDKPLIQYAVEEAAAAGITEMIFVTGRGKRSIEDHFDRSPELDAMLERIATAPGDAPQGVGAAATRSRVPGDSPPPGDPSARAIHYAFVRQSDASGVVDALLGAASLLAGEPFAVILPDDLVPPGGGPLRAMLERHAIDGASVVAGMVPGLLADEPREWLCAVLDDRTGRERVIAAGSHAHPAPVRPGALRLGSIGRYVFAPGALSAMQRLRDVSAGRTPAFASALGALCETGTVELLRWSGTRFDCGGKLGILCASVAFGLRHPDLGPAFGAWLDDMRRTATPHPGL